MQAHGASSTKGMNRIDGGFAVGGIYVGHRAGYNGRVTAGS